jgi:hypothetical protein
MDFGGGSQQQNQTTQPNLPPAAQEDMSQSLQQLYQALSGGTPTLTQLYQQFPELGVAPLNAGQQFDISQFQNQAGNPFALNPQEQAAASTYGQLATGQGMGNAVQQAQNYMNQIATPTVLSEQALAGRGDSGAASEALANAGASIALPLTQLQAQETQAGAGGLAGLGQTSFQQGMTNLQNALTASGIPQQEAQAILQALYQKQMGQTNLGLGISGTGLGWVPLATGSSTSGGSSGTQYGFSV